MTNESHMSKKPSKPVSDPRGEDFDAEVLQAMRLKGWLLPQTEEDVALAEAEMEKSEVRLPQQLSDPGELLRSSRKKRSPAARVVSSSQQTEENLAWAARNGGEIGPEVRERMRMDRQRAETEADAE